MAPRRRNNRRGKPRGGRKRNLLPFEATFTYNQASSPIVYVRAQDFALPNNRPLGIVRYSVTACADDATALQITLLNGLEQVTQPTMTIGRSRCRFGGRMPVVLPRLYTDGAFQIMQFNFAAKIDSICVITIRLMCRTYGVAVRPFNIVSNDGFLMPRSTIQQNKDLDDDDDLSSHSFNMIDARP